MKELPEGRCLGEHRYFVCETVFSDNPKRAEVILACTACGEPKVNIINLAKKEN